MTHLSEQDLVLHYYGEAADARHLDSCPECRARYREIQGLLNVVSGYAVPERPPEYENAVWKRLEARLPLRSRRTRRWTAILEPRQWAASGLLALLLIGSFYIGRLSTQPDRVVPKTPVVAADNGFNDRVLLTAVGHHLDRSQYVLAELDNDELRSEDVRDLLDANRLYRQSAQLAGETAVADLLDELERLLVEIEHLAPSVTPEAASELRDRLRGDGLLFRVRVLGSELRKRDENPLETKEH